MVSICISQSADSINAFRRAEGFAVSILNESQIETLIRFASKQSGKFALTPMA